MNWLHHSRNVGVFAFVSEDEQKVDEVRSVMDYRLLSFEKGRYDEQPTYEVAKAYQYTMAEWQRVLFNRQRTVVGTPDVVKARLEELAAMFGVNEIVISTFTQYAEDRTRSYELLAEMFKLNEYRASQVQVDSITFSPTR